MEEALLAWYRASARDLPWRGTRDPYAILVSEVMLQQTQVERVIPRYERWLRRWPTAAALGDATTAEVIVEWQGLGYNRRAVSLHRAAQHVVRRRIFVVHAPAQRVGERVARPRDFVRKREIDRIAKALFRIHEAALYACRRERSQSSTMSCAFASFVPGEQAT